jgi:F420-dependent oxidoreductase-like protein
VVEGWHGQPWGKPLAKTREYVGIVRAALRREVVAHDGEHYSIPWDGPGATGLGKPLKLMLRPLRAEIPIYLAALGPKNVALAAEVAEGWQPIFYFPEKAAIAWHAPLAGGKARRDPALGTLDVIAAAPLAIGDDVTGLRDLTRPVFALYIGGMGARGRNFYYDLACRFGYEDEARGIQDAYLAGRKDEAASLVPADLVEKTALIGPAGYVAERLEAFRESGVTTLNVTPLAPTHAARLADIERVRALAG